MMGIDGVKILTLGEALAERDAVVAAKKLNPVWGPWRIDGRHLVCRIPDYPHAEYDIPFAECESAAAVLDWIGQVNGKSWATREVVGQLVEAFDDVFSLQGSFCGGGKSHPEIDPVAQLTAQGWIKPTTDEDEDEDDERDVDED